MSGRGLQPTSDIADAALLEPGIERLANDPREIPGLALEAALLGEEQRELEHFILLRRDAVGSGAQGGRL